MEMNIGFFASGGGTNVDAILRNIRNEGLDAKAQVVISDHSKAGVFQVAQRYDVPAIFLGPKTLGDSYIETVLTTLQDHDVNFIVLAGYLGMIPQEIIAAYNNRIVNIHPALLPNYGGKGMHGEYVHQAVIDAKETESGATIHLVNEKYDEGRILAQVRVPVLTGDDAKSLARRILFFEHAIYSATLRDIQQGRINLDLL